MRLFVAIELPEGLRRQIGQQVAAERGSLPRARWVEPANLHLTLAFLGERERAAVAAIGEALAAAHAGRAGFRLRLSAAGSFPLGRPARVTWLGLKGSPALAALHGAVNRSLEPLGHRPEPRPYHPHLTLARCPRAWPLSAVDALRRALQPVAGAAFDVARSVLMRSRLRPDGTRYEVMAAFSLGEAG